jgi:hypothetical protein
MSTNMGSATIVGLGAPTIGMSVRSRLSREPPTACSNIRTQKNIDDFGKYIASAKKHGLIEPSGDKLYGDLDELRKLRNRIHIQNTRDYPPRNEFDAFTNDKKLLAEKAVEKTFRVMATKYARKLDYVDNFNLPWEPHFS